MTGRLTRIIFAGVAYLTTATSGVVIEKFGERCGGVHRWDVKILNDDNLRLSRKITETTIADLHALETPDVGKKTPRQDLERKRVRLKGVWIIEKIREADEDLHLVLADDEGNKLIAEIPYYDCPDAKETDFADDFLKARINFVEHARDYKTLRWDVAGILFVDLPHGNPQHGVADNNIEIHPVVKLEVSKEQ